MSSVHQNDWRQREAERKRAYNAYLRSPAWREKRNLAFATYGMKCQRCSSVERLEVHHKTYIHFGNEPLEDLQILCWGCHVATHWIERRERRKKFQQAEREKAFQQRRKVNKKNLADRNRLASKRRQIARTKAISQARAEERRLG